jgi:5-methylcytosine-specific restriction endonuclease McrA
MNSNDLQYYLKYRKFYNKYRKIRHIKLMQDPLCERCIEKNPPIIKSAQEVHHKKHISEGLTYEQKYILATDINNLESLCIDCHTLEHNKYNIPSEFW